MENVYFVIHEYIRLFRTPFADDFFQQRGERQFPIGEEIGFTRKVLIFPQINNTVKILLK